MIKYAWISVYSGTLRIRVVYYDLAYWSQTCYSYWYNYSPLIMLIVIYNHIIRKPTLLRWLIATSILFFSCFFSFYFIFFCSCHDYFICFLFYILFSYDVLVSLSISSLILVFNLRGCFKKKKKTCEVCFLIIFVMN